MLYSGVVLDVNFRELVSVMSDLLSVANHLTWSKLCRRWMSATSMRKDNSFFCTGWRRTERIHKMGRRGTPW